MTDDVSPRTCAENRIALGAYVLGSLEPAERSEVDRHLTNCLPCREVLADLAAVPGLLARTTIEDLRAADVSTLPDQAERAVRELGRRRHVARRRQIVAACAAAVLVVSGTGIGLAVTHHNTGTTVSATNPTTHVQARIDISNQDSGTAFVLHLTGVDPGEQCELIAVSRTGAQEIAANWVASYQGKADVRGESAIPRADLAALRVVTTAGRQLVTIPVG